MYYLEVYEDEMNPQEILYMFENKENLWTGTLIQPQMYQKALDEFCQFGRLERFPTNKIYQWAHNVVRNILALQICTEFYGNSQSFPINDFLEFYFYDQEEGDINYDKWEDYKEQVGARNDYEGASEFLDERGFYDWAVLPNGEGACSDYIWTCGGTREGGYNAILQGIDMKKSPEELLVLINKALDMWHQSGDLSCMLIQGGQSTLNKISGSAYVTEMYNRMMKKKLNEHRFNKILTETVINEMLLEAKTPEQVLDIEGKDEEDEEEEELVGVESYNESVEKIKSKFNTILESISKPMGNDKIED